MNPATESQLAYIKKIESLLKIHFEGESKQEAFLWIQKHSDKYHEIHQLYYVAGAYSKKNSGGGEDERGFHSTSQGFSGDESDFY